MEQTKEQTELIPESSAAKLALYFAFIPLAGFLFYMGFAFLGLIQIGRGRLGFYRLRNGFIAVLFLSVLPIAGLIAWAELPHKYYVVLNKFTKHGRVDTVTDGQLAQREYFRFGKSFRRVAYRYHDNGQTRFQAHYVGDKLEGSFTYWYDDGKPRLIETFSNNKRNGLTSWFDKSGKLEKTMNYVDGISQEQIAAAKKAGVEPVIEADLGGGVKMRMIFIPPGEFIMGSSPEEIVKLTKELNENWYKNEGPQHKVTIKKGFYLCETEVTQAQWKAIMGENPSRFKGDLRPVEWVSWYDCQKFLEKLNAKGKGGYRLPSEAEWEFAARAGTTTRFCFGDNDDELADYAWFDGNSGETTHPVATLKSNSWGLFDMHGNVLEWCADDWHSNYEGAPSDGKAWIDRNYYSNFVHRGGYWNSDPQNCRSALRFRFEPDLEQNYTGGVRFAKSLQ